MKTPRVRGRDTGSVASVRSYYIETFQNIDGYLLAVSLERQEYSRTHSSGFVYSQIDGCDNLRHKKMRVF